MTKLMLLRCAVRSEVPCRPGAPCLQQETLTGGTAACEQCGCPGLPVCRGLPSVSFSRSVQIQTHVLGGGRLTVTKVRGLHPLQSKVSDRYISLGTHLNVGGCLSHNPEGPSFNCQPCVGPGPQLLYPPGLQVPGSSWCPEASEGLLLVPAPSSLLALLVVSSSTPTKRFVA